MTDSIFNEIKRKIFHIAGLSIPIGYYFVDEKKTALIVMALVTVGYFGFEILRQISHKFEKLFIWICSDIIRPEEHKTFTATGYYLLSSILTIALFSKEIAITSLFFLILGDSNAALVGKRWGRIKMYSKTLEGSMACFATCFLIALVSCRIDFLLALISSDLKPLIALHPLVALVGAFTATIVEFVSKGGYDNFTIPLASGFIMQILAPQPFLF